MFGRISSLYWQLALCFTVLEAAFDYVNSGGQGFIQKKQFGGEEVLIIHEIVCSCFIERSKIKTKYKAVKMRNYSL